MMCFSERRIKVLRIGWNRTDLRWTSIYLLVSLLGSILVGGCGESEGKKVVAFVQATKESKVNQAIMERYAWPIFRSLEKSGEPFSSTSMLLQATQGVAPHSSQLP